MMFQEKFIEWLYLYAEERVTHETLLSVPQLNCVEGYLDEYYDPNNIRLGYAALFEAELLKDEFEDFTETNYSKGFDEGYDAGKEYANNPWMD